MTAVIIPFPLKVSNFRDRKEYTIDLMHLDLTAQCLRDHGRTAEVCSVSAEGFEKGPKLNTDATLPEVMIASKEAYETLCSFMSSECDIEHSDLPNQQYFATRVAGAVRD
ncbi:hypothetical protein N0B44_13265 [Roseibacterium beibuensis]|uniref:Uncharacterized protein n=1 Tax=[Roseibacterium] beibuensis TaxID=1193142 RepID=A0ABP9L537_9RHOB|nr:hypothetical protein [Roseibacterium beibuensis]MCS6623883.1 hypothetical protein [Roseibacterium beibuensis]